MRPAAQIGAAVQGGVRAVRAGRIAHACTASYRRNFYYLTRFCKDPRCRGVTEVDDSRCASLSAADSSTQFGTRRHGAVSQAGVVRAGFSSGARDTQNSPSPPAAQSSVTVELSQPATGPTSTSADAQRRLKRDFSRCMVRLCVF